MIFFFCQESLFNYLMLPTYVEADISTDNYHLFKNFRTGKNFKEHLLEFFREQSSVDFEIE